VIAFTNDKAHCCLVVYMPLAGTSYMVLRSSSAKIEVFKFISEEMLQKEVISFLCLESTAHG